MRSFLIPCAGALLALASACAPEGASDSLSGGGTGLPEVQRASRSDARIELLGEVTQQLAFGQSAALDVRYTEPDGSPIENGVVSFALVGRSNGSSLQRLDVVTDDSGMARNTLLAGSQAGSFQVRISAEGSDPLYVDVAVSDRGFGALTVFANYEGSRFVERRTVVAQADALCEETTRRPGDPMLTLTELGPARFPALPAGRTYAVTVFAEGPQALPMARGCTDGVRVEADLDTPVTVQFIDEPLAFDGRYPTLVSIDSSAVATVLGDALYSAGAELIESDAAGAYDPTDAEARYLLDRLDRVLRSEELAAEPRFVALADELAAERATPTLQPALEAALQQRLDAAGVGALGALDTLVEAVRASAASTRLQATFVLGFDPAGTLTTAVELEALEGLAVGDAPTPPRLDLTGTPETAARTNHLPELDRIDVTSLGLQLAWGALGAQSLGAAVGDASGLNAQLHQELGCAELLAELAQVAWSAGQCDGACAGALCARALNTLAAAAEDSLLSQDAAYPLTGLYGELFVDDTDGDLDAESVTGSLAGSWQRGATPGAALDAQVSGRLELP